MSLAPTALGLAGFAAVVYVAMHVALSIMAAGRSTPAATGTVGQDGGS